MRAGIYVRVSTEEQAKEGYSLAAQRRVLEAWATVKGCTSVTSYVDEGYSAKNLRRPQAQALIRDCKTGMLDIVIVWRLDRLFRNLRDTLDVVEDVFRANNVELISTSENIDTSTPSGRLMLNILASFAQAEREGTEERVRMVSTELAKQCQHMGGVPPFGYKVVSKQLCVDDREAYAIRYLFSMYDSGHGYNQIIRWLNDNGFKTRRGGRFGKNSLHDILTNEKYVGVYVYNRSAPMTRDGKRNSHASKPKEEIVRVENGIPAIISKAMWERVQAKMQDNQRNAGRANAKVTYLLTGLVFCGKCGRKMTAQVSGRDRNGTMQRRYVCAQGCVKRIRYEQLDKLVTDYLLYLNENPEQVESAATIANNFADTQELECANDVPRMEAEIESINRKLRGLVDFVSGSYGSAPASLLDEMRDLEKQRDNLQAEIGKAMNAVIRLDSGKIIQWLKAFSKIDPEDLVAKKEIIAQHVRSVTVFDDRVDVVLDNRMIGGGDPYVKDGLSGVVFTIPRRERR